MSIKIVNSTLDDIEEIFRLYRFATAYQKTKSAVPWPEFAPSLITKEIEEQRQWKILIDNQVACVWAITFDDPYIWEEKNEDPAIYIHRIATHPEYRGHQLVSKIVNWTIEYAKVHNKQFIRMDTVGENRGLITYYEKCGFDFLGLSSLKNTEKLPAHYHNATVSLFELKIP
ncbi:GNAT family N-acetyltransferase [Aquimarina hainanensis]|uniref:GNAT family N-acetyltransferase n=1 Tax=Aquimarina hainanensis TaxID=1578017 RepID=A0ABW5NET8_9FLAO